MTNASGRLLARVNTVLFDLDGTLLDTAPDLVAALQAVCAEQDQPAPPAATAASYVSRGAIGLVSLAFPDRDANALERLRARLVEIYQANLCARTRPYPGVMALLAELDERGVRWGIVTNKLRFLAAPIIEQMQLARDCAVLVGGDCAAHNKPHPAPLQLAMAQIGANAAETVYVGDACKDIVAGRAAGTATVAVTWGYIIAGDHPAKWDADFVIEQPGQLINL